MDKLAKRAGVTALVMLVTAGSAFAWGLARFASSVDTEPAPRLKLDASLKLPKAPVFAAVATPTPELLALAAPGPSLAAAVEKSLGASKKPAARAKTALAVREPPEVAAEREAPRADDLLDFGPDVSDREAKLAERGAKAFSVRQPGGAAEEHRAGKGSGEHVIFETDLAKPGDH